MFAPNRRFIRVLSMVGIIVMNLIGMIHPVYVHSAYAAASPVTLRMNIGDVDPVIDPVFANGIEGPENFLVHQLFLGLFRVDEDTGDVLPELATGYTMNPGATVFTIDLRTDAEWTDTTSVTAADVRYGILRTLEVLSPGYPVSLLYLIQNAEDYNDGTITDPNLVGIEVLSTYQIRFTLNSAAAYFPSLLSMPFTKAMPESAITAHPSDWTEPANIVTNAAYELSSWIHGTSMELTKNEGYFDAANVQIGRVIFNMSDETTAWNDYQDGTLDTVIVPATEWGNDWTDGTSWASEVVQMQLHIGPRQGTYYYGFNVALAPFDNPLVRKAFIAAIDREGLIENTVDYANQAALTFTAPGVFGHVDGVAEGIGIPFNPSQAQAWLTAAGYPGGAGFPTVTLDYNDDLDGGNEAIALYIKQNWFDNLNVSVTTNGHAVWNDYLSHINSGASQVWRMGWVGDYSDAYNHLYDAVVGGKVRYGNWTNTTYETHLSDVLTESSASVRYAHYEAAEEILVETDAVMAPLYYYGNGVASSPFLERTYGHYGWGGRLAEWRLWHSIVTPDEDVVEGINFGLGLPVTLEIDNDDNPGNGILFTATKNSEPAPTGLPITSIVQFIVGHAYDIEPGQYVRLSDGTTSTEQVVQNLSVNDVDTSGDTVSGSAVDSSEILVWPNDCTSCAKLEEADVSDSWTADFSSDYDIVSGSEGFAWQLEDDGITQALWIAEVPGWSKEAVNGFWIHDSGIVSSLAVFNSDLYAGMYNPVNGSQLWRFASGWQEIDRDGFGNSSNEAINRLIEFEGDLYASTWADDVSGAEIWRSSTGDPGSWGWVVSGGFDDLNNMEIMGMHEFGGQLYASTTNLATGGQLWRSSTGDKTTWEEIEDDGFGSADTLAIGSLEVHGSHLYAGTYNTTSGGGVWRSDTGILGSWTSVSSPGFGDAGNTVIAGFADYQNYLYAITENLAGTEIWRCQVCSGSDWSLLVDVGMGDSHNAENPGLIPIGDRLYAVVGNFTDGLEVWRSLNGLDWEVIASSGFGDADNDRPYWDNAIVSYNGDFHMGTINFENGGELWRQLDYGVSVDPVAETKPGQSGNLVVYTIQVTNQGEVTDTFDVTISGETWTTTAAATIGPIAPGGSADLTVDVTVPPTATLGESDIATITVTSQADDVETADSVLTTWVSTQLYLPLIMR